jgi:hypothetical protein
MPTPPRERLRLELELTELPGQIAGYRRDLTETPAQDKTRREMLDWQIRRDRKRLAETKARLAGETIGTRRYMTTTSSEGSARPHGRFSRRSSSGPEYAKLRIRLIPGSSRRGPTPQMKASSYIGMWVSRSWRMPWI